MQYLRHLFVILSGLLVVTACNSDEGQKSKETDRNTTEKVHKTITTQQLLNASLKGDLKYVKEAVKQDFDINKEDASGKTALMLASYNGHSQIVQYLLENEANANATDNQGRTPLAFAASGSFPETVKNLLENGADPNRVEQTEQWTPLMWAAAEGNEQVVRILLDHGADPTLKDKDDETAWDFATTNGYDKISKLLKRAKNSR